MTDTSSPAESGSRVQRILGWGKRRSEHKLVRFGMQWFKSYLVASRNSACAISIYSCLSVVPAALVFIAVVYHGSGDVNVFAQHLVDHLRLTGDTATLVQQTFGSASVERPRGHRRDGRVVSPLGNRDRPDLPERLRESLGDRGGLAGRPGSVHDLLLRLLGRVRGRRHRAGGAGPGRKLGRALRRGDRRLARVLARGALLPAPPADRLPPAAPGGADGDRPRRRHGGRRAALPAGDAEPRTGERSERSASPSRSSATCSPW